MKPSEIEVGDELKIRSWDDMVNEFGTDRHGNILCDGVFMKFMEHICDAPFMVGITMDLTMPSLKSTHANYHGIPRWLLTCK